MKTKDINMKEAQATAKLALTGTPADRVGKARNAVDALKANAAYATQPEVQQVTTAFAAAADALENNVKALAAIRAEEQSLLTSQIVLLAGLARSGKSV